ncbi:MAG: HRDC domain-containing protein [Pseudomonadales bacterium]|nr:HRDC domain-containing protein [Pseudomonadales bacterium]
MQRPLSESQLSYAVEDVRFLLDIHQILTMRLKENERLSWVQEECQGLIKQGRATNASQKYYLKFRNACHFSYNQQRFLQALCVWREEEARRQDRPKGFILEESCLLPIAEVMPESQGDLHAIQGVGKRQIARYGESILSLVAQVNTESPDDLFEAIPAPLRKESKPLLDGVKKASSNKAKALGLKPELLLRRKTLEALLQKLLHSKITNGRVYFKAGEDLF